MRWPFMLRRTHDKVVAGIHKHHNASIADMTYESLEREKALTVRYQRKVDAEYARARAEGIAQVHAWAREVNYNLFYGMPPFGGMSGTQRARTTASLQDAEHQFAPTRTQLEAPKEISDEPVRP